jgi:hypothetical protein
MTDHLYEIGIIFTQRELENLLLNDLQELDLKLNNIKKLYSNQSTLYVKTTLQDLFQFQLNKNKIFVWNYSGGILILNNFKIPHNGWKLEYSIEHIFKTLDNFTNGLLLCAGDNCGHIVKYDDVKNNVSQLGFFCDQCWENKYKNLAKKEKYD